MGFSDGSVTSTYLHNAKTGKIAISPTILQVVEGRCKVTMNPAAKLEDRPLPTGWICRQSKSRNKHYYFNTVTGESSWKHPLDDDLSTHSQESTKKRAIEADESSTCSRKKKRSKSKRHKIHSPGNSGHGQSSDSHQSGQPNKIDKMPETPTNGQSRFCGGNSKVRRISEWVDSVDHSYEPSEQGTCITSPAHSSHSENPDFFGYADDFAFPSNQKQNQKRLKPAKKLNNKSINSEKRNNNVKTQRANASPLGCKGSLMNDSGATSGKQINTAKNVTSSGSNFHTPFSSLSDERTPVRESFNKRDTGQKSATMMTCNRQSTEGMQLDNPSSFHGHENGHFDNANRKLVPEENEMAMDVDNYEELEDQIRVELQGIRSEFTLDPLKVAKESDGPLNVAYSDTLYVVLDTNVLLSHLKLVSELKDYPIEGVARPVLVIPWIVIQELDSLKSDSWKIKRGNLVTKQTESESGNFGVDALARQAVRFLHTCFENNHPRVRGQTVSEAQEMMENCSIEDPTNDDKILQCCLLFQRKADVGHSVLFSNDQNLCSKAMINGLKAFNHKNLVSGLKELFQSSAVVLKQDYFQDYYKELKVQETLAEKRAKADDIVCELQCVMREGLAVVVETEMRAAYDELWDKIVYIKPPWTLADLLQLLDKHWIAVFGQVFKRSTKSTVEGLNKHFRGSSGVAGCLATVSTILDQANVLFKELALRSSYNGAVTKCLTAIIVLKRKCSEYQQGNQEQTSISQPPVMGPPAQVRALKGPGTRDSSHSSSNETEQENSNSSGRYDEASEMGSSVCEINTAQAANPHSLVLSTFETIWNAVNQFSAQIFTGVGFPHSVPDFLEDLAKPTREEAIHFLGKLCSCLALLVSAIQSVLQENKGIEPGNSPLFDMLLKAIVQFFQQILSMDANVSVADLMNFAIDPNARMGLIQGCSQLDRALATLQQCSTWVASNSSLQGPSSL